MLVCVLDSVSIHGSVQGESDSEPEGLINTLSSNLDSIFSSDSSDGDVSEDEDEIFDNTDKPIFITSKGPVQLDSGIPAVTYHCWCCLYGTLSLVEGAAIFILMPGAFK